MFDIKSLKPRLPSSVYSFFSWLCIFVLIVLLLISIFVFVMAILLNFSKDSATKELFLDVFSVFSQEFQTKLRKTIDLLNDGTTTSLALNRGFDIPPEEIYSLPTILFKLPLYGILYVSSLLIFLYVVIVGWLLVSLSRSVEDADGLTRTLVLFFLAPYLVFTIFGPILFIVYSIETAVKGDWTKHYYNK